MISIVGNFGSTVVSDARGRPIDLAGFLQSKAAGIRCGRGECDWLLCEGDERVTPEHVVAQLDVEVDLRFGSCGCVGSIVVAPDLGVDSKSETEAG